LERRTIKSNTDKNEIYHAEIQEELARVEREISAAVNGGNAQAVLEPEQKTGILRVAACE